MAGIMNTQNDLEIGTINKPPRLSCAAEYSDWKMRMESFIYVVDINLWTSIICGPHCPTVKAADGTTDIPKDFSLYNDEDHKLRARDMKAYALLTMGIMKSLMQQFTKFKTAHSLWAALQARYEGNSDLKQSRKDALRKQYELFNHIPGETLENQMNRYERLINELITLQVTLDQGDINKKLLESLLGHWSAHAMVISGSLTNHHTMKL